MKKGLNFHLKVNFDGLYLEDVEEIDFIFKEFPDDSCKALKKVNYPGDVIREEGTNNVLVPFSAAETYMLPEKIYMDTRIRLKGTTDQPETNVVDIKVNDTLFERDAL